MGPKAKGLIPPTGTEAITARRELTWANVHPNSAAGFPNPSGSPAVTLGNLSFLFVPI